MPRRRARAADNDDFSDAVNISDAQLVNQTAADDEAEVAEPLEVWEPVQMRNTDFTQEDDEFTTDPDFCFLCDYSQSAHEAEDNQNLAGLLRYADENFHLVTPKTLVKEIQLYYNCNLRPYLAEPKVWRKEIIWRHFDEHAPSTRILHESTLRTYCDIMRVLRDGGLFLKEQSTGKLNVDKKVLDMFLRVERQRTIILNRASETRTNLVL